MKIQLDTKSKNVKLDKSVNLGELHELLEKFLPDGQWKEYTLETNTVINNWTNPIVIDRWVPRPHCPWWQVTSIGGTFHNNEPSRLDVTYTDQSGGGIYNLSVK